MLNLSDELTNVIGKHALQAYPLECCGVIIGGQYHPCANIASDPADAFEIDPVELVVLAELGDIEAIVHSHPDGTPYPSDFDKIQMSLHGVPWIIASVNDGLVDILCHDLSHTNQFLLGREYIHGTQDCYSLVRDFYSREFGVKLPDFERTNAWWENPNHEPLYEKNCEKAGFYQIDKDDLQYGDILLCRVGRTHHTNHALIWLGNNKLKSEKTLNIAGDNLVLHHPHGRLSVRECYDDKWQKRTVLIIRHKELMN